MQVRYQAALRPERRSISASTYESFAIAFESQRVPLAVRHVERLHMLEPSPFTAAGHLQQLGRRAALRSLWS